MNDARERLTIDPLPGYDPQVGLALAMLEETRQRTRAHLDGLADADLDWAPAPGCNSIATVLYHLAVIEADWLYTEILETAYPPEAAALFPRDVRDADDLLTAAKGETLAQLTARLDAVRGRFLDALRGMSAAEFRRVRSLPDYDVTPEYVLHHLMQHEAEHRGEMGVLRVLAAGRPSADGA